MSLGDIAISYFGSMASVGALVWIFKNWIKERLIKSIQHEYSVKLESHKNELKEKSDRELLKLKNQADIEFEKYKVRIGPYSEKQFERYNELWVGMVKLKSGMNELWDRAEESTLKSFSRDLKALGDTLEKSALLVEPKHYEELIDSIKFFAEYKVGKQSLLTFPQVVSSRR